MRHLGRTRDPSAAEAALDELRRLRDLICRYLLCPPFAHDAVTALPGDRVRVSSFRIDTRAGVGRPTPEGTHRDGVDFVAVVFVGHRDIRGGETRVFEAGGPHGVRFTLAAPWTALLLDDTRVIHESTPIQPLGAGEGHRDTLVLTYRGGGFQARRVDHAVGRLR